MSSSVLSHIVVTVLGAWSPVLWITTAAQLPHARARRTSSGDATYRGRYRLELTVAEVDVARAKLALLRRAAVNARRWGELRQLDGAATLLERSLRTAYLNASAANDAPPTSPGPAAAQVA